MIQTRTVKALTAGWLALAGSVALLSACADGVVIDDLRVGSATPREEFEPKLFIRNRSFRSVVITGAQETCDPDGCNDAVEGLPIAIVAWGSATVAMKYSAPTRPGPFRHRVRVYTNSPEQPIVDVYVQGEVH